MDGIRQLQPYQTISGDMGAFEDPPLKDHLHVIVQPPVLSESKYIFPTFMLYPISQKFSAIRHRVLVSTFLSSETISINLPLHAGTAQDYHFDQATIHAPKMMSLLKQGIQLPIWTPERGSKAMSEPILNNILRAGRRQG